MDGQRCLIRPVKLFEARHAGIERRNAAARKTHHCDARRVDARIICENVERDTYR